MATPERTTTGTTPNPVTSSTTGPATEKPQVEVYDTDGVTATDVAEPSVDTQTGLTDVDRPVGVSGGTNWAAIIIGLLVIIALIWLLIWIF